MSLSHVGSLDVENGLVKVSIFGVFGSIECIVIEQ